MRRSFTTCGGNHRNILRSTSQAQCGRDTDPVFRIAKPVNNRVLGKLIYSGEFEIQPDYRGKPHIVYVFLRLLQALAAINWPEFNAMYAIVPANHVKLADGYGLTWPPRAITWNDPVPPGRLKDHWLVAIDRAGFDHIWAD